MITLLIKRKRSFPKRNLLIWLSMFFSIGIIISCNNSSDSTVTTTDTSDSTAPDAPIKNFTVDSKLDVLSMTRAQFDGLVPLPGNPPDPPIGQFKKWVLKHCLTDQRPGNFTLSVWPERTQRYQTQTLYLDFVMPSKRDIGDTAVLFGDQKLNQQQVKDIRSALRDDPTLGFIIFVPDRKLITYQGVDHSAIVYDIFLSKTISDFKTEYEKQPFVFASLTTSNPSPPAAALDNANQ